jgi:dolichyl-phosphate beta-glucosyltransferase
MTLRLKWPQASPIVILVGRDATGTSSDWIKGLMQQGTSTPPICTIVVPTYNASGFIAQTVADLGRFLDLHPEFCVLFVCDGCTDDTVARLSGLIAGQPNMRAHVYLSNRGKGYAVRTGLTLAQTPYRIFTDCDLAYPPEECLRLLKCLEEGADMVVVNRASPNSRFLISPRDFPAIYKRHRMSRCFNWFLRKMLPITILDTQAGLKGITARAWQIIESQMMTDGFFIDVELLARAGKQKMRIVEIPVTFNYVDLTTVRMVTHGWSMILDTIKLRWRMAREGGVSAVTTHSAAMADEDVAPKAA